MYNVNQTVISQYANSPTLTSIVGDANQWLDPTVNLQDFYNLIWNISTAQGFGLDIWGVILGVSRYLEVAAGNYFGFYDGGVGDTEPFNQAPFYTGGGTTDTYALSDSSFLTLLLAKAFANICATTIPMLNQLLTLLFGEYGESYVIDNGDMSITYQFNFAPTAVQLAIIASSGVIPYPTGVAVTISHE